MHKKSFYEELSEVLKNNQDFVNQDGSFNRNAVINEALKYSEGLLECLYSNVRIQDKFFIKIKDIFVFKQKDFIDFISDKYLLAGSYTQYKNKIGLSFQDKYLKANNNIVLSFPFKDCVLEGGQRNKDEKKNEKFYNEVLSTDEIDRLFDPKVLSNGQRITPRGEETLQSFKKDEQGHIQDNLLIKGNNLLALYSLKEHFAGKVKLIYIDPPYNTGNDDFKYNDTFHHSTWLVFMKNRLEIARELLREDGVIFVQCDDNEQAYLKVLMDEIFGREEFVATVVYKRRKTQANLTKWVAPVHEYILMTAKNKNKLSVNRLPLRAEYVKSMYKNPDNDPRGPWRTTPLAGPDSASNKEYALDLRNGRKIVAKWFVSQKKYDEYFNNNLIFIAKNGQGMPNCKLFLKDNKGQIPNSLFIDVGTTEQGSKEIENLFGSNGVFSYAKPEALMERILQIATQPQDLVLDFFAGSGTTGAVAHKMGRRWIMVEQMDYIETITKVRMQKVIGILKEHRKDPLAEEALGYDEGGISKAVNWQGGGDFVYLELKKLNQGFIDTINHATKSHDLIVLKQEILEKGFLDDRVNVDVLKTEEKDFNGLRFAQQKEILLTIVDKNQLYVNYSERDDILFQCTKEEIHISEDFYTRG